MLVLSLPSHLLAWQDFHRRVSLSQLAPEGKDSAVCSLELCVLSQGSPAVSTSPVCAVLLPLLPWACAL